MDPKGAATIPEEGSDTRQHVHLGGDGEMLDCCADRQAVYEGSRDTQQRWGWGWGWGLERLVRGSGDRQAVYEMGAL